MSWIMQYVWGEMITLYEGVSKSFRTGRLERELQMVQLSATRCSCIAIFWVSLLSFVAITLCVTSQRVFIVVNFVIDSVRKLLDTPSYKILVGNAETKKPGRFRCKWEDNSKMDLKEIGCNGVDWINVGQDRVN
jgi:hypothetical protein